MPIAELRPAADPVPALSVWQVCGSLAPESGGTAAACVQLVNRLAGDGVHVSVVALSTSETARRRALDPRVVDRSCRPSWPARAGYCPSLAATLAGLAPADALHLHGLWRVHYAQAARFARHRHVPAIVSLHGMLHRHARRQRGALKRAAGWLFQNDILDAAHCVHATSDQEAEEARRFGVRRPIAVIPWGTDVPEAGDVRANRTAASTRTMLYLGRFHPGKGLDSLIRAWVQVAVRFPAWRLLLAGYDEQGYRSRLEALVRRLGGAGTIAFAGPVEGAERERLFASAELVILPSPAENFGMVVPEALVRGVPVVATHGSPWSALAAEGCGWWIPAGESALAMAIGDALGRDPGVLREMGQRGRRFARARFTWDRSARAIAELYEWAAGRRPEPAFIQR